VAAPTTDASSTNPRAAPILYPAGPETEVAVITHHGITIGGDMKACKRQNAGIAVWRRKDVSCAAPKGLPKSDGAWSI